MNEKAAKHIGPVIAHLLADTEEENARAMATFQGYSTDDLAELRHLLEDAANTVGYILEEKTI